MTACVCEYASMNVRVCICSFCHMFRVKHKLRVEDGADVERKVRAVFLLRNVEMGFYL